MQKLIARFAADESGATAIEYALIAALVSIVIIGTLATIGDALTAKFDGVLAKLESAGK